MILAAIFLWRSQLLIRKGAYTKPITPRLWLVLGMLPSSHVGLQAPSHFCLNTEIKKQTNWIQLDVFSLTCQMPSHTRSFIFGDILASPFGALLDYAHFCYTYISSYFHLLKTIMWLLLVGVDLNPKCLWPQSVRGTSLLQYGQHFHSATKRQFCDSPQKLESSWKQDPVSCWLNLWRQLSMLSRVSNVLRHAAIVCV